MMIIIHNDDCDDDCDDDHDYYCDDNDDNICDYIIIMIMMNMITVKKQ